MNQPDRTVRPAIRPIELNQLRHPVETKLDNGIPLFIVDMGEQEVLSLRFLFDAGILYQEKSLVASLTNKMLIEGTADFTTSQIAEELDYYGADLETDIEKDLATVGLFTVSKHLGSLSHVLEDILKKPIFPDSELSRLCTTLRQNFIVNQKKVGFQARIKFYEQLFGKQSPYGSSPDQTDYSKVTRDDLVRFHRQHYHASSCKIILAGKVNSAHIDLLNKTFGGKDWIGEHLKETYRHVPVDYAGRKETAEVPDVVQTAIRIGKVMIHKDHYDYTRMKVVNTILGGYFGSRLMMNIREDKGYTYGIGSDMLSFRHAGVFFIATQVGVEDCQATIDEIYKEIHRLRNKRIPKQELELVKNYMLGSFIKRLDGPFAIADLVKGALDCEKGFDYYSHYLETIKTITADDVLNLAQQYLDPHSMVEVIAGKR